MTSSRVLIPARLHRIGGRAILVAASVVALAGCGSQPGNPAVYDRINSMTDCAALQHEFDIADENHSIQSDEGDTKMARISTSYMEAADNRMRELGCYG